MLAINNFIPKINTSFITPQYGVNNRRNNNPYPNLAPLKQDTVSFKATPKAMSNMDFAISLQTATDIHDEAKESCNYLKYQLNKILAPMVKSKENPDGEIEKIGFRVKTPKSIREKSATRRWINKEEVKSGMTDIIGARIVMDDSSVKAVDKVIDLLAEAERNNQLQIIEIENFRPEPQIDDEGNILHSYDYSSPKSLRRLKKEIDKNGTMISKRDEDVPTGYMAIHLLTKLPNGFTGEIQIMGKEVEKLKEIEDLCYKVKNGKTIEKKCPGLENILAPLKNKDDMMLRREYNKYTRNAYKYQRDKEAGTNNDDMFLKIPDYLPAELDFNLLGDMINNSVKTEEASI